ncbi:hypothetical protein RRG08_041656 [Elysia crispata]|uniref:DUF6729 domain-containing protein n=1 Tax=Elysia crispata TaxID=231223 RepID=A0AAE0YBW6_9GAST|nr:hypothetical protein RRG08_041656 [Elysia crispata]
MKKTVVEWLHKLGSFELKLIPWAIDCVMKQYDKFQKNKHRLPEDLLVFLNGHLKCGANESDSRTHVGNSGPQICPSAETDHTVFTEKLRVQEECALSDLNDSDEDTLVQLTHEAERAEEERKGTQTGPSGFEQLLVIPVSDASKVALRKEWLKTASTGPVWVANGLFTESGRSKSQIQMWWHPPQPALVYSQPPATTVFFLWMPYRMLAFPFLCSQPGCDRR